jgi:OOP family OmpA-OmpF porin
MKKLLLGATLCLVLASTLYAQQGSADKNAIAAKLLFIDYGNPNSIDDLDITNGVELTYVRSINKWLNFGIPLKFGVINVNDDINNRNFFSLDGILQLQYQKAPKSRLIPYLFGGAGYNLERDGVNHMQIPAGAGLNIRVGGRSYVNLQGEYRVSQEDNRDNLQLGVGLLHRFGNMDSDGDGVADAKDECPDLAGSASAKGCPDQDMDGIADKDDACPARAGVKILMGCPDADGDGVADDMDKCPMLKGSAELSGCPDADGDGIADSDDECPDVKGVASAKGCPDADGDGVADAKDKCPEEKGLAQYEGCPFADQDKDGVADEKDDCPTEAGTANGCPDTDGDGVADKDDLCPNRAGSISGCPDTDGDGVHDGIDACPEQKGSANNKGCPEIEEKDQETLNVAMRAVRFQTGKATLKSESNDILDQIVEILERYPAYSLRINGHTDSVGDSDNNQILSEDRAKSCYQYLVSKGISPDRISYKGYGESQPVASNSNSSGRRKNRRVEFDLYLK